MAAIDSPAGPSMAPNLPWTDQLWRGPLAALQILSHKAHSPSRFLDCDQSSKKYKDYSGNTNPCIFSISFHFVKTIEDYNYYYRRLM